MNETIHWGLPLLASGQAQKEITHNEAIAAIDRLIHLGVKSRSVSAPPVDPLPGDSYIVGSSPTTAWAAGEAKVATYEFGGWTLAAPRIGCLAWVEDENQFVVFTSAGWSTGGWPARGLQFGDRHLLAAEPEAIAPPAGGVTVDSECRTALAALLVALRHQGVIH